MRRAFSAEGGDGDGGFTSSHEYPALSMTSNISIGSATSFQSIPPKTRTVIVHHGSSQEAVWDDINSAEPRSKKYQGGGVYAREPRPEIGYRERP